MRGLWWRSRPPDSPLPVRPIVHDAATTPSQLVRRVIVGAPLPTAVAALFTIVHQIGEALVPVLVGRTIDAAIAADDLGALLVGIAVIALDFVVLSFGWRYGSRFGLIGLQSVNHRLRMMVTEHLLRPGPVRAARPLPGAALTVATSDCERLATAVAIGVYPLGELAAIVLGGAVMLWISWPLGLSVLVGVPLLLWLMTVAGRPLERRSSAEQGRAAATAGRAADLIDGYRVIRGVSAEREAAGRYRTDSQDALRATLTARTSRGLFEGVMDLTAGVFLAVVGVAAGLLAVDGLLTIGELITVVGLTQFLIGPIGALPSGVGTVWSMAKASAQRILDTLHQRVAVPGDPASGVDVAARSPDPTAAAAPLRDLRSGEFVVVVASGSDAQELVAGLRDTGPIAPGRPDPNRPAGFDAVLVAPHAADLFDGTVQENLMADVETPPGAATVAAALAAAGCLEVLSAVSDGLQTQVGESGSRLSGGQRQRVALARALLRDPALLVLHEPTTAIDSVTESAIAQAVRRLRIDRTTVVVTTSPAFAAVADRVVAHPAPAMADRSTVAP